MFNNFFDAIGNKAEKSFEKMPYSNQISIVVVVIILAVGHNICHYPNLPLIFGASERHETSLKSGDSLTSSLALGIAQKPLKDDKKYLELKNTYYEFLWNTQLGIYKSPKYYLKKISEIESLGNNSRVFAEDFKSALNEISENDYQKIVTVYGASRLTIAIPFYYFCLSPSKNGLDTFLKIIRLRLPSS